MCEFCPSTGGYCCVCQSQINVPSERKEEQEKEPLIQYATQEDFSVSKPSSGGSGRMHPKKSA